MHARKVKEGNTLHRILRYLYHRRDGWVSNMDITMACWTPSLSAAISELRQNGHNIECRRNDAGYWYRLHTSNDSAVA